ncbi:MAG: hypothetical protein EBY28_12015 [Betaproteobacteria bacterium]|nr:hypothetical protein [Betaproteobacteria bacterium]
MPDEDPNPAQTPLHWLLAADLQDNLMVASNDLDRLQRLLCDASETLMGHFDAAANQIRPLARLAAQHPELPQDRLHEAMVQLSGAITALQFQDMASQLLEHTHSRLRHCADQLAQAAMDDDEDGVVQDAPTRPNPVTQDEMDAGSVELF